MAIKENSIEEDMKSINKGLYELEDSYELHQARWAKRIFENIKEKLEHILSDYKRVLKENEELKVENSKMRNIELASKNGIVKVTLEGILDMEGKIKNSIPVQKVKDKIEELKQKNIFTTIDFIKTTPQDIKNTVIQELQELLEGRK